MEPSNQNKQGLYGESLYPPMFDNEPPPLDDYEDDFGDFGNFATFESTGSVISDDNWSSWSNWPGSTEETQVADDATKLTSDGHNEIHQDQLKQSKQFPEQVSQMKPGIIMDDNVQTAKSTSGEGEVKFVTNNSESKPAEKRHSKEEICDLSNGSANQKRIFIMQNDSGVDLKDHDCSKGMYDEIGTNLCKDSEPRNNSQALFGVDGSNHNENSANERPILGATEETGQSDPKNEIRPFGTDNKFGDFEEFESNAREEKTVKTVVGEGFEAEWDSDTNIVLKKPETFINFDNQIERHAKVSLYQCNDESIILNSEGKKINSYKDEKSSLHNREGSNKPSLDFKKIISVESERALSSEIGVNEFSLLQEAQGQVKSGVNGQKSCLGYESEESSFNETINDRKHSGNIKDLPRDAFATKDENIVQGNSNSLNERCIGDGDVFDTEFADFQASSGIPVDELKMASDCTTKVKEPQSGTQAQDWASFGQHPGDVSSLKQIDSKNKSCHCKSDECLQKHVEKYDDVSQPVSDKIIEDKDDVTDLKSVDASRDQFASSMAEYWQVNVENKDENIKIAPLAEARSSDVERIASSESSSGNGEEDGEFDGSTNLEICTAPLSRSGENGFQPTTSNNGEDFDDFEAFESCNDKQDSPSAFPSFNLHATCSEKVEDGVKDPHDADEESFNVCPSFNSHSPDHSKKTEGVKDPPENDEEKFEAFSNFDSHVTVCSKKTEDESRCLSDDNDESHDDFQNFNSHDPNHLEKPEDKEIDPPETDEDNFDDFQNFSSHATLCSNNSREELPASLNSKGEDFDDFQNFNAFASNDSKRKEEESIGMQDGNWEAFSSSKEPAIPINGDETFDGFSSWPTKQNSSSNDEWAAFGSSNAASSEDNKFVEASGGFGSFEKQVNFPKATKEGQASIQAKNTNLSVLLSPCFALPSGSHLSIKFEHSNLEICLPDVESQRPGGIWGALTQDKGEEVNWNVSFISSNNFKSMLSSMNVAYESIMKKWKKTSLSSLSPTSSIASFDAELSSDQLQILMPEPAGKMTSLLKPTLLAQSQQKELKLQRVPSISSLKKGDSGSDTTSETASLDLDFFSSGAATSSTLASNKDLSTSLTKMDLFGVNMGGEDEATTSSHPSNADATLSVPGIQQQQPALRSDSIISSLPFNLEALNRASSAEEISGEARQFLDALESLTFMTSKALMFPSQLSGDD